MEHIGSSAFVTTIVFPLYKQWTNSLVQKRIRLNFKYLNLKNSNSTFDVELEARILIHTI